MRAGTAKRSRPRDGINPRALGHRRLLFTEVAVPKFGFTRCERESTFAGERSRSTFARYALRKTGRFSIVSPESRL